MASFGVRILSRLLERNPEIPPSAGVAGRASHRAADELLPRLRLTLLDPDETEHAEREGGTGLERNYFLKRRCRLRVAALNVERVAQVRMPTRVCALALERASETALGILEPPQFLERDAELVQRIQMVRPVREHCFEVLRCPAVLSAQVENDTESVTGIGIPRREFEGSLVHRRRIRDSSLMLQRLPQAQERIQVPRREVERAPIACLGLSMPSLKPLGVAQVHPVTGIGRVGCQRAPEEAFRFGVPALRSERDTEPRAGGAVPRGELEGSSEPGLGLGEISRLQRCGTQSFQQLRVAGIIRKGPSQQLAGSRAVLLLQACGCGHLERLRMAGGPFQHLPAQALGPCRIALREGCRSLMHFACQCRGHRTA